MVKTPAQIIKDNGDPAAFAEKVGAKPGSVRLWKWRNRFPRSAWLQIATAFPDLDLSTLEKIERVSGRAA